MKDKYKYLIIIILIIILSVLLYFFFKDDTKKAEEVDTSVNVTNIESTYEEEDVNLDWKSDNVNYIDLNNETSVEIKKAGTYCLSGTMNGNVTINVENKDTVKLVLNNANITSNNTSTINVENAHKVIILVEEGTTNNLVDGTEYNNLDEDDEPNANIFSKDDLVINGKGTLNITANYEDGIASKDDLKILNLNLNITSKDDAIRGKDSVCIENANITIKSEGDGIKSTNDTDTSKGYIIINNGNYNIDSSKDAITAETILKIETGSFIIKTGDGSSNSSSNGMGNWQNRMNYTSNSSEDETSCKGLKAKNEVQIHDGNFEIDSSDDSIHSNGIIAIYNGTFNISSGDDGIHSDEKLEINDGTINIIQSYEGIESSIININNGTINIVASDDGINVAGGNDMSSMNGRPGQNNFETSNSSSQVLTINNGTIYVNAKGDGLDANGSIYINGGIVYVDGPEDNGNGALDYDSVCKVTGGTVIAAGSSGMLQTPSNDSTKHTISIVFTETQQANTKVSIKDSNGNIVIEYTPSKSYMSIVISSEELKKDETYEIYLNDEKYSDITISSIINSIGNSFGNSFDKGMDNRKQPQKQ